MAKVTLTALDKHVGTLYSAHAQRARKAGARLEYNLAGLRIWVRDALDVEPCRCPYCFCVLYEGNFSIDHSIAVSRGGRWAVTNLELICFKCNRIKNILSSEEFGQLMALLRTWNPVAGHDVLRRLQAGWKRGWR